MSIKYKFIMEDSESNQYGPGREVSHTVIGEQTWDELLPRIEEWLRGVGYIFNGTLAVVDDKGEVIDV